MPNVGTLNEEHGLKRDTSLTTNIPIEISQLYQLWSFVFFEALVNLNIHIVTEMFFFIIKHIQFYYYKLQKLTWNAKSHCRIISMNIQNNTKLKFNLAQLSNKQFCLCYSCSWNQPVQSYEGKVSCSKKQWSLWWCSDSHLTGIHRLQSDALTTVDESLMLRGT